MEDCRKWLTIKGLWRPARRKSLILKDLRDYVNLGIVAQKNDTVANGAVIWRLFVYNRFLITNQLIT